MAQCVIDRLESIQIQKEYSNALHLAGGEFAKPLAQMLIEQ